MASPPRQRGMPPDGLGQRSEPSKFLGEPTRVHILSALAEAGELCVCDIAAVAAVPETSVSHALGLPRTAGIVRNRRSGPMDRW